MNAVSPHPVRWVVSALAALALLLASLAATFPASAQTVSCERVPYNERIIVVCSSEGTDVAPTTTPVSTSADGSDKSGSADDGDAAGADDSDLDDDSSRGLDDDDADGAQDDDDAGDGDVVDRGDRGGRTPGPDQDDDDDADDVADADAADDDSGASDNDGGAVFGVDDEPDDADPTPDASAPDNSSTTGDDSDDDLATGSTLTVQDDDGLGVLPVAAGFALLAVVGAGFSLATRRENSSGPSQL